MWKTPISTADKSSRGAGVKPGSVDIPGRLMAPNELNRVCVTSGRQSGCRYQIEVLASHSAPHVSSLSSAPVLFDWLPLHRPIKLASDRLK